jgi:hypothetical protein
LPKFAAVGEFLLAVTIAEEAIVANVLESTWKDMDQEAADDAVAGVVGI